MHSCQLPSVEPECPSEDGGEIAFVDLGDAALVLPGGMARAKAELKSVLTARYNAGLAAIGDPDLADQ